MVKVCQKMAMKMPRKQTFPAALISLGNETQRVSLSVLSPKSINPLEVEPMSVAVSSMFGEKEKIQD
jgi:hypothetical protein